MPLLCPLQKAAGPCLCKAQPPDKTWNRVQRKAPHSVWKACRSARGKALLSGRRDELNRLVKLVVMHIAHVFDGVDQIGDGLEGQKVELAVCSSPMFFW